MLRKLRSFSGTSFSPVDESFDRNEKKFIHFFGCTYFLYMRRRKLFCSSSDCLFFSVFGSSERIGAESSPRGNGFAATGSSTGGEDFSVDESSSFPWFGDAFLILSANSAVLFSAGFEFRTASVPLKKIVQSKPSFISILKTKLTFVRLHL